MIAFVVVVAAACMFVVGFVVGAYCQHDRAPIGEHPHRDLP